jgi:hypothetical protein
VKKRRCQLAQIGLTKAGDAKSHFIFAVITPKVAVSKPTLPPGKSQRRNP